MKRAKKRKGGLRIETQFTFNQFEEFEGSTKGYRGKREMQKGGGSKSREKGKTVEYFLWCLENSRWDTCVRNYSNK